MVSLGFYNLCSYFLVYCQIPSLGVYMLPLTMELHKKKKALHNCTRNKIIEKSNLLDRNI